MSIGNIYSMSISDLQDYIRYIYLDLHLYNHFRVLFQHIIFMTTY